MCCVTSVGARGYSSLFKDKTGSNSTDMRQISKAVARGAQGGSARPATLLAHLDQRRARAARHWAHMQSVLGVCAARSRCGCGAVRREDMGSRNCRVVSSLVYLSRKMVCDFWDLHRPSSRAVARRASHAHTHTRSAGLTGPCTRSVRDAPASHLHLRAVIRPSRAHPSVPPPLSFSPFSRYFPQYFPHPQKNTAKTSVLQILHPSSSSSHSPYAVSGWLYRDPGI